MKAMVVKNNKKSVKVQVTNENGFSVEVIVPKTWMEEKGQTAEQIAIDHVEAKIINFKGSCMKKCCGERHPRGANFYVSVIDGPQVGLLLGPFKKHSDALSKVEWSTRLGQKLNRKAWFYSFGTVAMPKAYCKPGLLNNYWEQDNEHQETSTKAG